MPDMDGKAIGPPAKLEKCTVGRSATESKKKSLSFVDNSQWSVVIYKKKKYFAPNCFLPSYNQALPR